MISDGFDRISLLIVLAIGVLCLVCAILAAGGP